MSEETQEPNGEAEEFVEESPEENDAGASLEAASEAVAAAPEDAILQPCSGCGGLIDVADQEPFAQVHCPMCGTLMRARTQLKNFALTEVLGSGGMGAVYKATDVNLKRMVALKVVRREFSADAVYLAKFEREARITASVTHPHVVKVFSFGSDHGLFYIAMELVDKGSLDDLMNLQGRVSELQVLDVGIQVAQGLQAAHKKGLIHRDVKPGNILFADARVAKIVDFGLALLAEHEAEERGEVWGTPYYVAPEKLSHEPEDFRSDIYSLGGTLFHAVAGRPPFEAETASLVALKHIKSKAVSLQAFAPDVGSATAFVVNKMMQKDPAQRYQSYDELLEHLQYARAQLQEGVNKPRQKARVVVESAEQQKLMGVITLGLLALMIAAGVLLFVFRDRLFNKDEKASEAAMSDSQRSANVRYEAARKQIVGGDFANAGDALGELSEVKGVPQPLKNWITLHEGIADLFDGRLTPARGTFKELAGREMKTNGMQDDALASFFSNVARMAGDADATKPEAAKNFDGSHYGALAPLVFGLKDWEMGKFDEGAALLQSFLDTTPQEPFTWISDYKPLVQPYIEDFGAYRKLSEQLRAAKTREDRAAALKAVDALKAKAHGKLADELDGTKKSWQQKFTAIDDAETKKLSDTSERDGKVLGEVQKKALAFLAPYQFDEALAAAKSAAVADAGVIAQRDALVKKMSWLVQFKAQLMSDINRAGYPNPLVKRNGTTLPAGTNKATAKQLDMPTPYGPIPFAWTDLPPATLLKMAQYFVEKETAPERTADRKWFAGVFAFSFGMAKDGRAMLLEASQTKDAYKENLGLFIEGAQ